MPAPLVRFDDGDGVYEIANEEDRRRGRRVDSGEHVCHIDDFGPASATSLKHALGRACDGEPIYVCTGPYEHFKYDYPPVSPVRIECNDGKLELVFEFEVDDYLDEPKAVEQRVQTLLSPLFNRTRSRLVEADMVPNVVSPPWIAYATLAPATHGRTIADIFKSGEAAHTLMSAASTGALTRDATLDLLRAGHVSLLIGRTEGQWLDVKSQDYDLYRGNDRGKISLAQDVARFANSTSGGIVAVGFATRKVNGNETITRFSALPPLPKGTTPHTRAVDQKLFPPVEGLTVEEIRVQDGSMVIINVPPQPEEAKPFLVSGAIVNDRIEGAFISIVQRRGEDSIPVTAQSIHSTLAAGRALLRRGIVPAPEPDEPLIDL